MNSPDKGVDQSKSLDSLQPVAFRQMIKHFLELSENDLIANIDEWVF